MRPYQDLVDEAMAADVTGWDFGWLEGRATEERPPWGYVGVLRSRLAATTRTLDVDTGGGEVLAEALGGAPPGRRAATEGWAPNAARARELLAPYGVEVVLAGARLPFADGSFELVTARHPVAPAWSEIARVLMPGGRYLAQHVGPASVFELIEEFTGPLSAEQLARSPESEIAAAEAAGLALVSLARARCRIEIHDVGAVVWLLRRCVWWVPDFSVPRYEQVLRRLDARMRSGEPFVAHSTRHLLELAR